MASLHLGRRRRTPDKLRWERTRRLWQDAGTRVIADWLLTSACCVGVAALLPRDIRLIVLAALLSISGYLWLAVAITRAGPPASNPYPTAWDAALLSLTASFAVQAAMRLGV